MAECSIQLYDFQEQAVSELRAAISRRLKRILLVAPTGSGKSLLAAYMIHGAVARGLRIGFLVNRRELVKDLCRRLDRIGVEYGVIMGGDPRRKPWLQVHVASIDTLHRRDIPKWDIAFIDEAHVGLSPKYLKVIGRLDGTVLIGMTATPCLTDGRGMGMLYEAMVRCPDTPELIERGYLVPPRVFAPSSPDVSAVKITAGEYNQKELAAAVDRSAITGDIVEHWKTLAYGRPTAAFAVDVEHSKHITEKFRAAGISAWHVDGETPDGTEEGQREWIWERLADGRLSVVSSVGVISYGWDVPPVSCAILARPTQSLALHLQQIGRVLRTHSTKTDAIILDHAGNCLRHGLPDEPREWTLEAQQKKSRKQEVDRALLLRTCKRCWGVFSTRLTVCPHYLPTGEACLTEYLVEQREVPEEAPGQLQEIKSTARFVCSVCRREMPGAKDGDACGVASCTRGHAWEGSGLAPQNCPECGDYLYACRAGKARRAYQIKALSEHPKIAELQKIAAEKGYRPGWVFVQTQKLRAQGKLGRLPLVAESAGREVLA